MSEYLEQGVELLGRMAASRGINWKTDADALPKGDLVTGNELLADRLGIGLPEELDPNLGEDDYARGHRADVPGMNIRVSLNGSSLGQFSVPRWQSYLYVIPHVVTDFLTDRIRPSGSNEFVLDPVYADESDYRWIGPATVHFRQNS
jgi:hypothetical protein